MRHWADFLKAILVPVLVAGGRWPLSAGDFQFPPGFLWGTATSSHQVEGGNTRNDWHDWEQIPGNIANGDRSGLACDHYHRFEGDLDLAREVGCNAYRLSIEWSRIEPEPGQYDEGEIEHYRKVLLACRQRGIQPMVTLFHFTLPRWALARGGFENPEIVEAFGRLAAVCGRRYGDLVDLWCTLNEPVVYALAAYGAGMFPPGKADLPTAGLVYANLIRAHGAAFVALKATDTVDADGDGAVSKVGIAKHLRVFDAWRWWNPADIMLSRMVDRVFNWVFLDACKTGEYTIWIPGQNPIHGRDPRVRGSLDYIGINYYGRDMIRFNPRSPGMVDRLVERGAPVSDMNWEIYPEGIYRLLMALRRYRRPIYITENGIADAADSRRPAYILDHLAGVAEAMRAGVDVRGYFHWSLMDNFEWAEGFWPRFGLYRMDYPTQGRTLTGGGRTFRSIATGGRIRIAEPGPEGEGERPLVRVQTPGAGQGAGSKR